MAGKAVGTARPQLALAFASVSASASESVLSSGLGQDGFSVVETRSGKVAVLSGADLTARAERIAGDRGAKTTLPVGGGWGPRAMVGRCRRDAMLRVGGRSPSCAVGSLLCVWDPDEMVVIHPS